MVAIGTWTGAGEGLGTCASAVQEKSSAEKQAAKRVIRVPILPNTMISLGLQREAGRKPRIRGCCRIELVQVLEPFRLIERNH